MTTQPVTLYGVPHSLYTGRARCYFIKAGIAYREMAPSSEHYRKTVAPLAGGRDGLPTIELPDGRVIRDGAAIIDHFEEQAGHPFSPATPRQRFISDLFAVIGAEGFMRPAMHYRWNFDEENLAYLIPHFEMITAPGESGKAMAIAKKMRKATVSVGVNPHTQEVVEAVYVDQLLALDRHFAEYPYLLGGRPSLGDFGLIAPMFAHLGRDPKPLRLMHEKAINVLRWVERMNRPAADLVGFVNQDEAYLSDDAIPATLIEAMRAIAEDFVPETLAAAEAINGWLDEQQDLPVGAKVDRGIRYAKFDLRGTAISASAQTYRFWALQRAQADYEALDDADRTVIDAVLEQSGMTPALHAKLTRAIGRKDNLEIWL